MRRRLLGRFTASAGRLGLTAAVVAGLATAAQAASRDRAHAAPAQAAEAMLLRMDVQFDAYTGEFYSDLVPLATRQGVVRTLTTDLGAAAAALGREQLPAAAAQAYSQFSTSTQQYVSALQSLAQAPDQATFDNDLKTLPGDAFSSAEDALRAALGLPAYARQSWFSPQPQGRLVYRDSLAHPTNQTDWHASAPNSLYRYGGFAISAPGGDQTVNGPSSIFSHDDRYASFKVDARAKSANTAYGIGCARDPKSNSSQLAGLVEPNGSWMLVVVGTPGHDNPPQYTGASGSSRAIHAGTNHLRLDCEQFAPGLAIARLYVNGKYLGYLDAPLNLARNIEPSLLDVSLSSTPTTTVFKHWSVYALRH